MISRQTFLKLSDIGTDCKMCKILQEDSSMQSVQDMWEKYALNIGNVKDGMHYAGQR